MSPYQKPASAAGAAYAQAPGTPPVELGPIRQPPKKRKAHTEPDDPYAPLGVRAGAFTLFPAIELIGGYDTNPGRVPGGQGASLYTVAPELQVQSNWSRHELKADLRGSYTGYSPDTSPTLSRPNFNGKLDGRVDVTQDTRIDLGSRVLVSTDNPGSPNLRPGLAKLPIFTTFGGSAGLGQKFNRLDLSIKGDFERTVYQELDADRRHHGQQQRPPVQSIQRHLARQLRNDAGGEAVRGSRCGHPRARPRHRHLRL